MRAETLLNDLNQSLHYIFLIRKRIESVITCFLPVTRQSWNDRDGYRVFDDVHGGVIIITFCVFMALNHIKPFQYDWSNTLDPIFLGLNL